MSIPNLAFYIAAQAGVPAVARGSVGVAKNAMIEAIMALIGYVGHVFIPSQHAPEDIGGVPVHDPAAGCIRMTMMEWLFDMTKPKRWLHMDEVTTAPNQMRPPMLSVLQEKRVGALRFHPTSIVTAACNPPDLCPAGAELEPALCNRLYHHDWVFPSDTWHKGLRAGGVFPTPAAIPIVGDYTYLLPKFGSLVSRLVTNKPALQNTERVQDGVLAFPTPRSWWNLCRALAAADSVQCLDEVRSELCAGLVGMGAGAELMLMIDSQTAHDVEAYLTGGVKVVVNDSTIDKLYSLPSAMVDYLKEEKRKNGGVDDAKIERAFDLLVTMAEGDLPDFSVPCLAEVRREFPAFRASAKVAARHTKVVMAIEGVGR